MRYYHNVNKNSKSSNATGMKVRYAAAGLSSALAQSSFTEFPVISKDYHDKHTLDLVPVHRLMHRWIPSPIRDPTRGKKGSRDDSSDKYKSTSQHACPVPTRIHM